MIKVESLPNSITVKDLRNLLAQLEDTDVLYISPIDHLLIFRDGEAIGYIDPSVDTSPDDRLKL